MDLHASLVHGSLLTLVRNCAVQFRDANVAPTNSIRKRWVRASHSASKLGKVSAVSGAGLLCTGVRLSQPQQAKCLYCCC